MSDRSQKTSSRPFVLKKTRTSLTKDAAIRFLNILSKSDLTQNFSRIDYPFPSIFENIANEASSTMFFTTRDRYQLEEGKKPNVSLYKSDIASFFFGIVKNVLKVKNAELVTFISNYYNKTDNATNHDILNKLSAIIHYCEAYGLKDKITDSQDQELNLLVTNYIKPIANFFLLDVFGSNEEDDGDEKIDKEGTDEKEGNITDLDFEDDSKRTSSGKKATDTSEDGGATDEPKTLDPSKDKDPIKPIDPLKIKELLFSKELREQSVRFSQIALVQLERQNGLPPGTLKNSKELQAALSEKTMGFFSSVIGKGNLDKLTSPETRLTLMSEYLALIGNDKITEAIMANHVINILETTKEPEIKKQIEESLVRAEKENSASPLIKELASNPEIQEKIQPIIEALAKEKAVTSDTNYLTKESDEFLEKELRKIGVSEDKIGLAKINVTNIIDSAIGGQGLPIEVFQCLDEKSFKILFGDDIPYNKEFLQSFEKIDTLRRSVLVRDTGQVFLLNNQRFVLQEALDLLKNEDGFLSKDEHHEFVKTAIVRPIITFQKKAKDLHATPREVVGFIHGKDSFIEKLSPTNRQKAETFRKSQWEVIPEKKRIIILSQLGYSDDPKILQNYATDTNFVPRDLNLALTGGTYDQSYDNGANSSMVSSNLQIKNPIAGIKNFKNKSKKRIKNLKKTAKGLKSKLSKKAAEKAANKIAEEGLSKAAGATAGAVNPALGIIAKLASTKKGRKLLAAGGAVGLMSLIVPLMSWGGRIGAAVGGVIGGLVGGPGGAAAGAIAGGWTGYGLEQGLSKLFGSSASRPNIIQPRGKPGFPGTEAFKGAPKGAETGLAKAGFRTTFQPTDFIGQTITTIGGQAVLGTVAVLAGGNLMMRAIETGALLADFPIVAPLGAISANENKASKFVNIEKRAFIAGCPENKCENPAFPVEVEYTIVIKPKGNFTIQIIDASDTLKTFTSKKAWEEEDKIPPTVPERVKTLVEFTELYEGMIIEPGEEITLSYSETLDETHNHASINNTFKLKVFGSDPETGEEGTDEAITGEVIYLGDYSQGAGCWPASGTIKQLPGGTYSHKKVDAYDISTKAGGPIFTPFEGEACVSSIDPRYGNHLTIVSPEGTFVYAHFASIGFSGCKPVIPGDFLGMMGTTGDSSGVHLHFERRGGLPSILETLMPSGDSIQYNDQVRTCYAQ